jgi:hypothetical protein
MDDSSSIHLVFEDHIIFQPIEPIVAVKPLLILDNFAVRKITGGTANILQVQAFTRMTLEFLLQYSLPLITTAAHPRVASLGNKIEVVCQDPCVNVARSAIYDIAYVIPFSKWSEVCSICQDASTLFS